MRKIDAAIDLNLSAHRPLSENGLRYFKDSSVVQQILALSSSWRG
nr:MULTISPECIES: hypothetical protein [Lonsdalea]